ncbi:MAG: DUF861 domain-containing protein [Deltaproteobacteria bacterium]|nr:DUF861 domain-containing protein [Deltaproteobacteria bacterium]
MSEIKIERDPDQERLQGLGVLNWPIWTKEVSEFPWGGEPVKMGKGDLVTFPAGMSCTWQIGKDVKKHYQFG